MICHFNKKSGKKKSSGSRVVLQRLWHLPNCGSSWNLVQNPKPHIVKAAIKQSQAWFLKATGSSTPLSPTKASTYGATGPGGKARDMHEVDPSSINPWHCIYSLSTSKSTPQPLDMVQTFSPVPAPREKLLNFKMYCERQLP